jgi:hypothetical protein
LVSEVGDVSGRDVDVDVGIGVGDLSGSEDGMDCGDSD